MLTCILSEMHSNDFTTLLWSKSIFVSLLLQYHSSVSKAISFLIAKSETKTTERERNTAKQALRRKVTPRFRPGSIHRLERARKKKFFWRRKSFAERNAQTRREKKVFFSSKSCLSSRVDPRPLVIERARRGHGGCNQYHDKSLCIPLETYPSPCLLKISPIYWPTY